jgi:hypothetical protein
LQDKIKVIVKKDGNEDTTSTCKKQRRRKSKKSKEELNYYFHIDAHRLNQDYKTNKLLRDDVERAWDRKGPCTTPTNSNEQNKPEIRFCLSSSHSGLMATQSFINVEKDALQLRKEEINHNDDSFDILDTVFMHNLVI